MITLNNVSKNYSSEVSIGPVDLSIPRGGITALVGPNGAGKSTMLTMIGRLLGIDEGSIEIAGMDVSTTKSKDLAKIVSILKQENQFITKLTVRQLVGFGRFPYSRGRLTTADEEIISRYIDFLNLREYESRYLDELSGGQCQRAYVAMVLAQETEYVLLDEPLNNLDIAHSVQMMSHLQEAAQQFERTIIVVLHDINYAARYAKYICAMKGGKVVEMGETKKLMQDHVLTEIFDTPIEVIETTRGLLACYH